MKYLPNLTGLRFLLATLVIIFHIPEFCAKRGFPFFDDLSIFHKGIEAVYLFFSLSGFLIIRILYVKKNKEGIDLRNFFKNRILRIFPLYYVVLVFGFLYYRFILPRAGFEVPNNYNYNLFEGIILGATFFANIFAKYSPGGILQLLWSIAIEEQFYIIAAPTLYFFSSKKIKLVLLIGTILFLGLFFFQDLVPVAYWSMHFYYFSFSGLISIICLKNEIFFSKKWFKGMVFLLVLLYFNTPVQLFLGSGFLFHVVTMVLFALLLACLSVKKIMILENRLMNYLGKISYGLYMYHAIVMNFVGYIFLQTNSTNFFSDTTFVIIYNMAVFIGTILISHFSFKYYESYFLKKKTTSLLKKLS